jgi:hypothetical protein
MGLKPPVLPALVICATTGLVAWGTLRPFFRPQPRGSGSPTDFAAAVGQVDRVLESQWADAGVEPAAIADELQVYRRLSLALVGTIPSLEEVRAFEADSSPDRLQRWTAGLISDWRFVEFFGERLAAELVNKVSSEFHDKYRQRFVEWLGRDIQHGRPYDEMVRQMIAGSGYWSDDAGVLFIESELSQGELAAKRLAARTVRAFLGQRIDCAQCHDHPFASWKQSQFEALAAHFGQVKFTSLGIQDTPFAEFVIDDARAQQQRVVEPGVPFASDNLPKEGSLRERLAEWVTHRENRRFRRATANRVWGMMFGRPFVRPVDDIPDPPGDGETDDTELLDVLGDDWAAHGYELRRLIQVIAASRAFRIASEHPMLDVADLAAIEPLQQSWAVFPVTQLTSAQLMRSVQQTASLKTVRIRQEASTYTYMWNREKMRLAAERYGESGDMNEEHQTGSIPQAVQRLVGPVFREAAHATVQSAAGRISAMTASDPACVEACYLVCLARRPTTEERDCFVAQLNHVQSRARHDIVEDIFWTLLNSPEFSWNH